MERESRIIKIAELNRKIDRLHARIRAVENIRAIITPVLNVAAMEEKRAAIFSDEARQVTSYMLNRLAQHREELARYEYLLQEMQAETRRDTVDVLLIDGEKV